MPKVTKTNKCQNEPYFNVLKEVICDISRNTQKILSTMNQNAISGQDVISEMSKIREFRGTGEYDLSTFIREVDMLLPLFGENTALKTFSFQRHVYTKIQGPALNVVRTLGSDATWEQIKEELIRNFGVKESYHTLHHQAISLKNFNVSEYFYKLRTVLDKLNSKYEYDSHKPVEFAPKCNEAVILRIFLNGLKPELASIIYSRNISKLRDAYYLLEETGLLKNYETRHSYQNQYNQGGRHQVHTPQTNNNYHQNTYKHSGQMRQNNAQSGQYRQNNNERNNGFSGQYSQRSRNPFRQGSGQNRQQPEPMEVDYIQTDEQVNFQCQASHIVYR